MYGWGGGTSNWRGSTRYDYDQARAPYLDKLAADASLKGPRTYTASSMPTMDLVDPRGKTIHSDSENPIIIAVDVTGSMSRWPAEIFDRLPLFYQTLSQYREDAEFCFAAIGDANCDSWPLQVNNFGKGLELEEHVKALGCEGGGGGQTFESYELFMYDMLHHCETPNAVSPFLFIFGDEKFYDTIQPEQVEHYIGDKLEGSLDTKNVLANLKQKFNVFYLQKPYGYGDDPITRKVKAYWSSALGEERVVDLPSMERAVDIAMGIIARSWGKYDDFDVNLKARQADASVRESVHKTVHSAFRHLPSEDLDKSVTKTSSRGMDTESLSKLFDDGKD